MSINKQGIYNITLTIKLKINPMSSREFGLNWTLSVCIFRLKITMISATNPIAKIKLIIVIN
jgi:hypothetical protein